MKHESRNEDNCATEQVDVYESWVVVSSIMVPVDAQFLSCGKNFWIEQGLFLIITFIYLFK